MRGVHAGIAASMLLAIAGALHAAPSDEEQRQVWDDVGRAARKGPVDVPLLDEAVLHVPAGEVFVPQPQADRLLRLLGRPDRDPEMPGLLLPRAPDATWSLPVRFHKSGHLRDDDASTWDADALLQRLRDAVGQANRERAKAGLPGVEVVGWSEPPRYDAAAHRLAWSWRSRPAGAATDSPGEVDLNACALGRDGYFSLNVVASLPQLAALRALAEQQVAAIEFSPGKRYADFDATRDRVAAQGLASLVVADAGAARPGPLAKMLPWIVPLVLVLGAALALVLRRQRAGSPHGA